MPEQTKVNQAEIAAEDADLDVAELTCSPDEIEEAVQGFLLGDLTLAQVEGYEADDLYAIADMGYDMYEEGRYDDALKIFQGLNALNHLDPYFHNMLGALYEMKGNLDKAISHLYASVTLYPDDVHSWASVGELMLERSARYQVEGNAEEAAEVFNGAVEALGKAIELDPKGENPASLRARTLVTVAAESIRARQSVN